MSFSNYSRQLKAAAWTISVGAVLSGCTAVVDPSEQLARDRLEQARIACIQAKTNPGVEAYALKTMQDAEKTLKEAEQTSKKAYAPNPAEPSRGYDAYERKVFYEEISRLAYMAEQKAKTAVALAEGVVTRNELVRLGKEKAEVQLLISQMEQKLLQQDLDEQGAALERARQQLATATDDVERAKILADIKAKEAALAKAQTDARAKEAERASKEAQARADAKAGEAAAAVDLARTQTMEAERARAELAQLLKEMSELQGQLTDRGIVLTIGDVLFATGKSDLNVSAHQSMTKLAGFLHKNQNRSLLVEGHTDSVGSDEYNQGLSEQRAVAVKTALVKNGIDTNRIVTIGYGKKFPLASNADAAGKQQNRRVEAIILNEGVVPASQFRP